MAVVGTEPVSFQQEREELDTVLRSAQFVRAPKLAHLLSYLCERLFAGETHRVKEYSIGVEVFGRGDSFDQDSDSIVRVEANRLRKRLAEYYAGEGANHPIQINIPVGQYVPEFRVIASSPPADAPAAKPAPAPESPIRRFPRGVVLFGLAGVLLLVGATGWLLIRHRQPPAPIAAAPEPHANIGTPEVGLPPGEEVRILCGATRSLVDHAGKMWSADTGFTGGTGVNSGVQHIARTQNPAFYRSSRQGNFRYDIPLKNGIYELRLHFAETEYGPETTGSGGEGNRIMTVRANGKTLLSGFDVAADAGSRTADVKVFPDVEPANDGQLHLEIATERGAQAMLSAIEILPGVRAHIRPVRILPRQTPYYSNDSEWWSPDAYFEGGQLAAYTAPVSGTDDPELYETERWGNFTYAIPVAPGRYTLTLSFAARHGDWPAQPGENGKPTPHVFNVFCNGKVLLQNFDLAREAHPNDIVVRRAINLEPNAQGKLLLSFVPVNGYATVTAIEVVPQ